VHQPHGATTGLFHQHLDALVGMHADVRVDERGRMTGGARIPKAGPNAEGFQLYVRTVAMECDCFEFQLTGRDIY
jgi:hypothetical protein